MATNAAKTHMINLALLKLIGLTSSAQAMLKTDIDDSVFASPTAASGANKDDVMLYCTRYPDCLKRALIDIRPKFARRYADLGLPVSITEDGSTGLLYERADWVYMFDLPSNFLDLIGQTSQGCKTARIESEVRTAHTFAHVVKGSDGQAYYCSADVTGAAANTPVTGASYATYWTLFSTDDDDGVDFETGKAYKYNQTGKILLSNELSNADGDAAYIEYLAYAQDGVSDKPAYYDQHFIEAFVTLLAGSMAPWSTEQGVRQMLIQEYERLARPGALAADARPDYEPPENPWLDARNA